MKAHYGAIFASVDGCEGSASNGCRECSSNTRLVTYISFYRNNFFKRCLFFVFFLPHCMNISILFLPQRRASKLQIATVQGGCCTGSLDFFKHSFLFVHEHVLADDKYQQNQSKQFFPPPLLNTCENKRPTRSAE